ncbi:MAG: MFS transporter [Candidatus Niyogibacteria bacterium]|nr:MFS transporter [Candidatus Niyogibacteria bacterium]
MIRWVRALARLNFMPKFFSGLSTARRDFRTLPASIKWVTLILSFYSLFWGLWDPFLPIYFNKILGGYTETALVTAFFYLFFAILSVPIGRIADILSKKKLIAFFLLLYLPLGPLLALMRTIFQFTLFRFYHAFLASGLWSASETYIRAHSPPHQRAEAMGFLDTGLNAAIVAGALLSGFIVAAVGIEPLFYVAPVMIGGALLLTLFYLPDHSGSSDWSRALPAFRVGAFKESVRDFLNNQRLFFLGRLSFLFGLASAGVGAVLLPLFSEALGATPIQIGAIFALSLVPFVFEAPFAVLAEHFSNRAIVLSSGIFSTVTLALLYFIQDLRLLSLLAFFLGLSFAMVVPILGGRATGFMPKRHIGELNGVYRAVGALAGGIGILIVGPLADRYGINAPFLLSAVLMAAFTLAAFWGWKQIEG